MSTPASSPRVPALALVPPPSATPAAESPAVEPGTVRGPQALSPWVRRLLPWVIPVLALATWAILSRTGTLSRRILPEPTLVVAAAWRLLVSGELLHHLAVSFQRAMLGFVIGGSAGFALGLVNGTSRWAEALFDTPIQMIRNVPHLALLPLVILWFGLDEEAKVFLVAVGVLFPIYVNTYHGARTVDRALLEMSTVYGLGRWERFRDVVLPGALPSILVGVRFALGVMWLSLIVAETIAADAGIGYLAMNAREFMQTDVVVMSILLYAALGKLADVAARRLERRWLPWHPNYLST
jgi:sulfonate transport system permease protein